MALGRRVSAKFVDESHRWGPGRRRGLLQHGTAMARRRSRARATKTFETDPSDAGPKSSARFARSCVNNRLDVLAASRGDQDGEGVRRHGPNAPAAPVIGVTALGTSTN